MQVSGSKDDSKLGSGFKYEKKNGQIFLNLSFRTDPDTFEEVKTYARQNNCSTTQAVRELVEIGIDTLSFEGTLSTSKANQLPMQSAASAFFHIGGVKYLAAVFGNSVLKACHYNQQSYSMERNPTVANAIRLKLLSESENKASRAVIDSIKPAVIDNIQQTLTNFINLLADQMSSERKTQQHFKR